MIYIDNSAKDYNVIGLMSGTSLDGVDLAFCRIKVDINNNWDYEIVYAQTIPYDDFWKQKLSTAEGISSNDFVQLHTDYGIYLGNLIQNFIKQNNIKADFVASHGHTIFHQPEKKYTVQIGHPATIAAFVGLPVVADFRSTDVALGGQGAPLVPIGDRFLFKEYDFCLNLGGFANVSYEYSNRRIAFDICPVNIVLNHFAHKLGKEFDEDGKIAKSGSVNERLLKQLNGLDFYQISPNSPKSLGKEWVVKNVFPLIDSNILSANDILSTFTEHIAIQIATIFNSTNSKVLATGGGVYNEYLIDKIKSKTSAQIIIPEKKLVEFKEALIFALLGTLRMRNQINCLKSVTGAYRDSSAGAVYIG